MRGEEIYNWVIDIFKYYPEQEKHCIYFIKNKNQIKQNQQNQEETNSNSNSNTQFKLITRKVNGLKVTNI